MATSAPALPTAVTRSRLLRAGAEAVWRTVTGADWLGFPDERDERGEPDGRGDGPAAGDRATLRDPFGDGPRQARVTRVEPGRALHLEWWPAGRPDDRSEVAITLEPAGEDGRATRVTVVETAVPAPDVTARAAAWTSCLQALAAVVDPAASPFALPVR